MLDPDRHQLVQQLRREIIDGSDAGTASSPEIAVLVVAAVLAATSPDLLGDAMRLATSTADRQFVAIAAAHVGGQHDRADALGRDHLLDHPYRPVLAWILAHSASQDPTPGASQEPTPDLPPVPSQDPITNTEPGAHR